MFIPLCENIRTLTVQAAELVADNQIELCLSILIKRQALLDELALQYQSSPDKNTADTHMFIELIRWIQQEDSINNAKIITLRSQSHENSMNQAKVSRALNHYKNIT
tara:strand:+ start:2538 stop:2858 length:321 start_codon:yes stop_codon:yes gene_type:complete